MNNEQSQELKKLILDEISFRNEFRKKRTELENLVDPITAHVNECCNWWEKNMPKALEIVVLMDNGSNLKISRPKREKCYVESYLPFGIQYEECHTINIDSIEIAKE